MKTSSGQPKLKAIFSLNYRRFIEVHKHRVAFKSTPRKCKFWRIVAIQKGDMVW